MHFHSKLNRLLKNCTLKLEVNKKLKDGCDISKKFVKQKLLKSLKRLDGSQNKVFLHNSLNDHYRWKYQNMEKKMVCTQRRSTVLLQRTYRHRTKRACWT